MVGPRDSVIGMDPGPVIERFRTQMFHRYDVARGPVCFNGVLIDLDDDTSKATEIRLVQELVT
jgi:calcineurin-like phosphoesterase